MSEECNHDCSNCSQNCESRENASFLKDPLPESSVKHIIAVMSGKGGVGKSFVTSLLAVTMQRRGLNAAILDADITGPSIPKAFGIKDKCYGTGEAIMPVRTNTGIQIISLNLLLENETDPVVWRGPIIASMVTQFWTSVIWKDVDYLFIDMPPGTGDVPLTVFQSIPVEGAVIVTSPQELVGMIVEKAYNMARLMNIKTEGIVENMSYFECPSCGTRYEIFGKSRVDETAAKLGIENVARIPIDPDIAGICDRGEMELIGGDWLDEFADRLEKMPEK
ncbi:MAG: P-loop NTPase [Oscillospiraceae bacterium]|jgi:Mrp family chromosome partitioning ATPase